MSKKPTDPAEDSGEGRAQPGDVVGFDTDGERTFLGDTREDEDKRREEAEQTVRERRDDGGSR
ncbi:MAG: hypothetical protein AB7O32_06615 [Vicinamibacterales bacterium]